jgi:hypothetical protein
MVTVHGVRLFVNESKETGTMYLDKLFGLHGKVAGGSSGYTNGSDLIVDGAYTCL